MRIELLDRTRKIGKLLQGNASTIVVFNDICQVLSQILESFVCVLSKKGKVLGGSSEPGEGGAAGAQFSIQGLRIPAVGEFCDELFSERLLEILSTKENASLLTLGAGEAEAEVYAAIITPVFIAGERLGTLFICREGRHYDIDDIILAEYGSTVVGLEMIRAVSDESDEERRKLVDVRCALSTLSDSEREAMRSVFAELGGGEGLVVASKLSDRLGITRSVVVNGLKKLESAGLLSSRSSGMKGTHIIVLNEFLVDEIKKLKKF